MQLPWKKVDNTWSGRWENRTIQHRHDLCESIIEGFNINSLKKRDNIQLVYASLHVKTSYIIFEFALVKAINGYIAQMSFSFSKGRNHVAGLGVVAYVVLLSITDKVHQSDTNTAIDGGLFKFRKTGPYPTRCSTTTCLCTASAAIIYSLFLFFCITHNVQRTRRLHRPQHWNVEDEEAHQELGSCPWVSWHFTVLFVDDVLFTDTCLF